MGSLSEFRKFIEAKIEQIKALEEKLDGYQQKFESFFQEVERVRESEFGQLEAHLVKDRDSLPKDFLKAVDKHWRDEKTLFEEKLEDLRTRHRALLDAAEAARSTSLEAERAVRERNKSLDGEEEALKTRAADLMARVEAHNDRIRDLGWGFGFLANYFKMRGLAAENKVLKREQREVAATIEKLRKEQWEDGVAEAAAVQTKIEYLESVRDRVIQRGAFEKLLFERRPDLTAPQADDARCPRCAQPNPSDHHFCHVCAQRLKEDRPDFEGSLLEMAELNHHHKRFSEGMKTNQEVIGLLRGVRSGLEAFQASVDDMMQSQRKYSLGKLDVEVPDSCLAFDAHFDQLKDTLEKDENLHLHPLDFGALMKEQVDRVFSEEAIKAYFEALGEELNTKAKAQWD